jgi:hypothetical protein
MTASLYVVATDRPALAKLVLAMTRLSRRQRIEIIDRGRKAKVAKTARIRRLTRAVTAEVRRLSHEAGRVRK